MRPVKLRIVGRHVSSERKRRLGGSVVAALAGIAVLICAAGYSAYQIVQRTHTTAPNARLRDATVRNTSRTPDPAVRTPAPSVPRPTPLP